MNMMNEFNVKLDIEPTDKYEKARKAVLNAREAISGLSMQQKKQLAQEVFGAEAMTVMYNFMQQYFG